MKRLVYAYAMWISPEFSFKVIDAFDTLQTRGVAVADHAAELDLEGILPTNTKCWNPNNFHIDVTGRREIVESQSGGIPAVSSLGLKLAAPQR